MKQGTVDPTQNLLLCGRMLGGKTMGERLRTEASGGSGSVILDDEEEAWVREQEAAMAKEQAPAAKVVRKPSRFAQLKKQQAEKQEEKEAETPAGASSSPLDKKARAMTDLMSVIAMPVMERDPSKVPVVAPKASTTAFPVPRKRDVPAAAPPVARGAKLGAGGGALTFEASGGSEKQFLPSRREIHEENEARLRNMSEEERREMLAEVEREIDPGLLKLMRERAARKNAKAKPGALTSADKAASIGQEPHRAHSGKSKGVSFSAEVEVGLDGGGGGAPQQKLRLPKFVEEQMREGGDLCNLPPPTELDIQKMQWMGDLEEDDDSPAPPPPGSGPTPLATLRFDFDGSVAQGGLTDARDGLHNHAATPKAPGYTIIELCTMARSSFISQRVTALGIIEALLVKLARRELPDGLFSLLADAEAWRLFPANLRDTSVTGTTAAAKAAFAFSGALASRRGHVGGGEEEECVRGCEAFFWQGVEEAATCLIWEGIEEKAKAKESRAKGEVESIEEVRERMVKCDMLRGMLEEDVVSSCASLLSVDGTTTGLHASVIGLLTIVAKHSRYAAERVASSPGLCSLLVDKFVHNCNGPGDQAKLREASICLIKNLCQASFEICKTLTDQGLLDSVKAVLLPAQVTGSITDGERRDTVQALRLWRVCIQYGLNAHALPDLATLLQETAARQGREGREALLLMEASTVAARPGGAEVVAWRHIEAWFSTFEESALSVPCGSEGMHCIAAYFESIKGNQRGGGKAVYGDDAERILQSVCLGDHIWTTSGPSTRTLAMVEACFQPESPRPSVETSASHQAPKGVDKSQAYVWVWGWVRLLAAVLHVIEEGARNSDKLNGVASLVGQLLRRASSIPPTSPSPCYVSRAPSALHMAVLELMPLLPRHAWGGEGGQGAALLVSSGLVAACRLGAGDEGELMWVMSRCVAVPDNIKEMMSLVPTSESAVMPRFVGGGPEGAAYAMCETLLRWAQGVAAASGEEALTRSKSLSMGSAEGVLSLSRPLNSPTLPLGKDLTMMPIRVLLNARGGGGGKEPGENEMEDLLSDTGPQSGHIRNVVNGALSFTLLLVRCSSSFLFSPGGLGHGGLWHRVASTYILGEDMFRHASTAPLLSSLLAALSNASWELKPDARLLGVALELDASSHKTLHELARGFAAESCGDTGYAQAVISSLQRHIPSDLRVAIWGELAPYLLRLLRPWTAGPPGGLNAYLFPPEDDEKMLEAYTEALVGGALTHVPFLFWLAVHHISCHIFGNDASNNCRVLPGRSGALEDLVRSAPVRVYEAVCNYEVGDRVALAMQGEDQAWSPSQGRRTAVGEWLKAARWRGEKVTDDESALAKFLA